MDIETATDKLFAAIRGVIAAEAQDPEDADYLASLADEQGLPPASEEDPLEQAKNDLRAAVEEIVSLCRSIKAP